MIPAMLAANPMLERWVAFGANETVSIKFGRVEYGQGTMTSLAQIGAEELDIDWARVRVEEPSTLYSPDEGLTVGSMSIEFSGPAVRQACAEVRALFLAHAAERLGCDASTLSIRDGTVFRDGRATELSYWSLAKTVDLKRAATGEIAPKNPSDYRIVGQSLPRRDLAPKVFGAAFLHDFLPEGVVHARVLRQKNPRAKLVALDEAAILKAAGAPIEIFREGQFVAFLSASEAAAERALVRAEELAKWEGGSALAPDAAEAGYLRTLPGELFETGAPKTEPSNRKRVTATYTKPYISHGSLGPSCGVAKWCDGRMTVWTNAQGVFPIRATIAAGLGIAPEAIDVHHMQGPGNYGHNGADDASVDAALIAHRHPDKPIRVQWRREDEFAYAPKGTAMQISLTAELDATGRIADYTAEIWSGPHPNRSLTLALRALEDPSAPLPAPMSMVRGGVRYSGAVLNATPSYDIEATRVVEHFIPQPPVRVSSLRGLGGPPNEFANECFVDELAEAAGQDPLAYRLAMLSNPRACKVLERAAELCGFKGRGPAGTGKGLGIAFAIHRNRGAFVSVAAAIEAAEEIRVQKVWCVVEAGLIINPDGARNQLEGGIVMATSWALKEQVRTAQDGITSTNWDSYPILRFDEVPEIEIDIIDAPHEPAFGLGEISSGPTLAAIGNALAHALGVRIRDLPFTRERVAAALLA